MDRFRTNEPDWLSNFQLSGLMRLNPDILGLRSWEQYKNMDFTKYKMIWIHFNPRVMDPPWYEYTKLIKDRAPNAVIVGTHEYDCAFFQGSGAFIDETNCISKLPYIIKKAFEHLDYYVCENKISWEYMREHLDVPVLYAHIAEPHVKEVTWLPKLPWAQRSGVFTLSHSVILPLARKFAIMKDLKMKSSIVSTNKADRPVRQLQEMAMAFQAPNVLCYDTLPWLQYLDVVRNSKVSFDIDYIGISRMSYECAMLGVPTVGTKNMEYRNILYPELTVKTPEEMVEKVLEVYNDEKKAERLNRYADMIIREYLSEEAVHVRTIKLLKKMGVDV